MGFDQTKYINDYSKEHYRQYNFRVSRELDQDIIEGIEAMKKAGIPINAFIRECIREALKDEKFVAAVKAKVEAAKATRI